MPSTNMYLHKKFDLKPEQYNHKKFGLHYNKRKHEEIENKKNFETAQTILDLAVQKTTQQQPPAKRKQTKPLFRPWLDTDEKKSETTNPQSTRVSTTKPNSVQSYKTQQGLPKQKSAKLNQHKSKRNLTALIARYNEQAQQWILQQQYVYYQQQQAAIVVQNLQNANYVRQLQQQLAVQRQGQLFVFGQQ